ncbi:hypothetical protein GY45DRAFT_1438648 [Cubamyces sp. BRFM 1775]|nr:hypothetical protein GY45DRAFT_1438648 [Cubamyces sp. BRFM 1775]
MAESTPNMTLPPDVFYHIVEELEDDPSTLRHIALTCRSLLPCARSSLYKSIALCGVAFRRVELLSRTLQANPELGALVKSLRISKLMRRATSRVVVRVDVALTPELLPFRLLRNLHTLHLHWLELGRGIDALATIVGCLPRLERLICETLVQAHQEHGARLAPLPHNSPAPTSPARFPVLRELVVKHGTWSHSAFAKWLLLSHRGSIDRLERITISFGSSVDALMWIPLIRTAAPRLRVASISITDTTVRRRDLVHGFSSATFAALDAYPNDHAYVMDNLSYCRGLQSLQLRYHPDHCLKAGTAPSDGPIKALCDALERHSPPWPSLQRLELWLVDRGGVMVAMSDELCARLKNVLADKTRYPRFNTLVLRIESQEWTERFSVWHPWSLSSQLDRAAVVERWKLAFGAFEREPSGVTLDAALLHSPGL